LSRPPLLPAQRPESISKRHTLTSLEAVSQEPDACVLPVEL
jgi:hypothetical protein